jgi:serine-type D-Ala-D-Ala carboxypeptidase/endopeptidase
MFIYDSQKGPNLSFVIIILFIIIIASPAITSVLASPPVPTTNLSIQPISLSSALISTQEEKDNSSSTFKITDQIKAFVNALVDKNNTNAAIVIGFIDPNGTQFYGHGKMSNTKTTTVDQNTIFAIGSITKVFTTTLLADMVNQGLIKLDDPIE